MMSENKIRTPISFFIPAYNCKKTIAEAVQSIIETNFGDLDELIIVNDGSTDGTTDLLDGMRSAESRLKIVHHVYNRGGGAARNTAICRATNRLLFCLDSDNILVPGSIARLVEFLEVNDLDVASFGSVRYFSANTSAVSHEWKYKEPLFSMGDVLSGAHFPGESGNYLFTRESYLRAGGYPEFAAALDTVGFGFRQLAAGARMKAMPESWYFHRTSDISYWARESGKPEKQSIVALQIILPYIDLIKPRDAAYILSPKGRKRWFQRLSQRPIRLRTLILTHDGYKAVETRLQRLKMQWLSIIYHSVPLPLKSALKRFLRGKPQHG